MLFQKFCLPIAFLKQKPIEGRLCGTMEQKRICIRIIRCLWELFSPHFVPSSDINIEKMHEHYHDDCFCYFQLHIIQLTGYKAVEKLNGKKATVIRTLLNGLQRQGLAWCCWRRDTSRELHSDSTSHPDGASNQPHEYLKQLLHMYSCISYNLLEKNSVKDSSLTDTVELVVLPILVDHGGQPCHLKVYTVQLMWDNGERLRFTL